MLPDISVPSPAFCQTQSEAPGRDSAPSAPASPSGRTAGGFAKAAAASSCTARLGDLPDLLVEGIFGQLSVQDAASAACVSRDFRRWAEEALEQRTAISEADFPSVVAARLRYHVLRGVDPPDSSDKAAHGVDHLSLGLTYAAQHCRQLTSLSLRLSAAASRPPMPSGVQLWAMLVEGIAELAPCPGEGDPEGAPGGAPHDPACFVAALRCWPQLRRLTLVNTPAWLTSSGGFSWGRLAQCCPLLEALSVGRAGGEECVYEQERPHYSDAITDAGLKLLALNCANLRSLELLRCHRVTDEGLVAAARASRGWLRLVLHCCPGVSERGIVQVAEASTLLEHLDVQVSRQPGDLLLWNQMNHGSEQLGFGGLFALAANCHLLREVVLSEEGLERGAIDDLALQPIIEGCPALERLVLRHIDVTDATLRALAARSKGLRELELEHSIVTDAGLEALVRGCPRLRALRLSGFAALNIRGSLQHLRSAGISDASLQAIAKHCTALRRLEICGKRKVTDVGLQLLAKAPPALLQQLEVLVLENVGVSAAGLQELLPLCPGLRRIGLGGPVGDIDPVLDCIAWHCRRVQCIDVRHSTVSEAGLAALAACPALHTIYAAFCASIDDSALATLAAGMRHRLLRLELYHVPRITAAGLAALLASCPALEWLNLGKCAGLLQRGRSRGRPRAVEGAVADILADRPRLMLHTCHYLDY